MSDNPKNEDRATVYLLLAGLTLGTVLAAIGILNTPSDQDPTVIAMVNDGAITKEELDRAVTSFAQDTKNPVGEDIQRRVLDRLIDEELMVQRGIELGLANTDRAVRGALTNAVINTVTIDGQSRTVSEQELEEFFSKNDMLFKHAPRIQVEIIRLKSEEDRDNALAALNAGESFSSVAAQHPSLLSRSLPDTLLPPEKLRQYIGSEATQSAMTLSVGQTTAAIPFGKGFVIIHLTGREEGRLPPITEVRNEVQNAYQRHMADQALRDYLLWLRGRATIETSID